MNEEAIQLAIQAMLSAMQSGVAAEQEAVLSQFRGYSPEFQESVLQALSRQKIVQQSGAAAVLQASVEPAEVEFDALGSTFGAQVAGETGYKRGAGTSRRPVASAENRILLEDVAQLGGGAGLNTPEDIAQMRALAPYLSGEEAFLMKHAGQYPEYILQREYARSYTPPLPVNASLRAFESGGKFQQQLRIGGRFARSFKQDAASMRQLTQAVREAVANNFKRLFPKRPDKEGDPDRHSTLLRAIMEGEVKPEESGEGITFTYTIADLQTEPWRVTSKSGKEYVQRHPPRTQPLASWLFFGHRPGQAKGSDKLRFFGDGHWHTRTLIMGFEGRNALALSPDETQGIAELMARSLVGALYEAFQQEEAASAGGGR